MKLKSTLAILAILIPTLLCANEPKRVLVRNFKSSSLDTNETKTIANYFANSLRQYPEFTVTSYEEAVAMTEQYGSTLVMDCDDQKCLEAIAGAIDAPYIISGEIDMVGSRYFINIAMIDVYEGSTVIGHSTIAPDKDAAIDSVIATVPRFSENYSDTNLLPKPASSTTGTASTTASTTASNTTTATTESTNHNSQKRGDGELDSLVTVVKSYCHSEDFRNALAVSDSLLSEVENDPDGLLLKGVALRYMGQLEESALYIAKAKGLKRAQPIYEFEHAQTSAQYATNSRSRILTKTFNRIAVQLYQNAVTLNPSFGHAWYNKGLLEKELPFNSREYRESISKALELLPNDPNIQAEARDAGII